jgi:hypothetical protein
VPSTRTCPSLPTVIVELADILPPSIVVVPLEPKSLATIAVVVFVPSVI